MDLYLEFIFTCQTLQHEAQRLLDKVNFGVTNVPGKVDLDDGQAVHAARTRIDDAISALHDLREQAWTLDQMLTAQRQVLDLKMEQRLNLQRIDGLEADLAGAKRIISIAHDTDPWGLVDEPDDLGPFEDAGFKIGVVPEYADNTDEVG